MGRTITPYSMQIEMIRKRLSGFRRALRKEEQLIFDEIFRQAKFNVQSGVMASNPNPLDSIILTVLIEQQKELSFMKEKIEKIEKKSHNTGTNGS